MALRDNRTTGVLTAGRDLLSSLHGRPHRALLSLAVGGSIGRSLIVLPVAVLVRRLVDDAVPARDTGLVVSSALLLLGLLVAASAVSWGSRRAVQRLTQDALETLRLRVVGKLYQLPRAFFDRLESDALRVIAVQEVARLESALTTTVAALLPALVVGAVVAVVVTVSQPVLALVLAVSLSLTIVLTKVASRRVRHRALAWRTTSDRYAADIGRALRAMTLTQVLGGAQQEVARTAGNVRALRLDALHLADAQASARAASALGAAAGAGTVLVAGILQVTSDRMTPGELAAFLAFVLVLTRQVLVVLRAVPVLVVGATAWERVRDLLTATEEAPYRGTAPHVVEGEIELQGVGFGYGEELLLREVSLHLRPGEHVALVGPNGAGKSTLALLVLGAYRPSEGRLLVDGRPYDDIDLDHLHQACGVVLQDPVLLPGSIQEAIGYGSQADLVDVERAAHLVGLHEFVSALPDGYASQVGDEGVRLSGGQRQRVALARALVRRPRVLVLDEPTNHLDDEAVAQLLDSLATLEPRPTILTLTHDLAVADAADRVLQVRDGRLRSRPGLVAG